MGEYQSAARKYNPKKCVEIFELLRDYDMRSKGMNNGSTDHGELLKELIFKIITSMTYAIIIITSLVSAVALRNGS